MKQRIFLNSLAARTLGGVVGALVVFSAYLAPAQKVPVIERTLTNGLRILMVERHDDPSIAGGWVAHVGSANERPGITGIAHLFEHMMFKGTPTIGTKDTLRDAEIMTRQEEVRELMRAEEAVMRALWRRGEIEDLQKPETWTPKYRELQKEFQKLIDEQRQLLVKNEFDRIYTVGGASGMNAFTSHDMTGYFITVPANKLELWMWMESERLLHPVFREFYAERDVVFEERRMRTDSTPLGKFQEAFESMLWESHPYNWPVIGWPSDIPAISKAQADQFYATYYAPQNITLILVGDFKAAEAEKLAERYFGRIPRGPQEPPDVITLEMKQNAEKRMSAEAETNPQIDVMWKTVAFGHPDAYALQVLQQLLSTRTGRLYKGMVLGNAVSTDADAYLEHRKWAGLFGVSAEVRDGKTLDDVEQAIYAELAKLREQEVPAEELQKVKNNFAANEYRRLSGNMAILMQLIRYDGLGNWHEINEAGKKIQAVTAADVKRVANKYFARENRTVGLYTRKPAAAGATPAAAGDDALAGLPAPMRTKVQQDMAKLKDETDVAKLRSSLDRLKQSAEKMAAAGDQVPKEQRDMMQKAFQYMTQRIEARIGELEKK